MAVFALVVLIGVAGATTARAQASVAGEFDRLVDIVEGDAARAERLAAAHELGELRRYMVPGEYASGLREAAGAVEDPLVEHVVRRRAARADLERGADPDKNRRFAADRSCLVDWELVGPFANNSMQGLYRPLAPERGEEAPYPGRFTDIGWRRLDSGHHLCLYQLDSRVHPSTSAAAYLSTTVEVDRDREATLLVGARGPYRIWVDGEAVGQRTDEPGLGVDAEGWSIDLEAGDNEILVKLASSGSGGLGWTARLVDERGEPIEEWKARPGIDPGKVATEGFSDRPDAGAKRVIDNGIEADSPSVRLAAGTLWRRLYSDDSETPWRDVAESVADRRDELSGRQMIRLARLYEDLWRRQSILDEAVERFGDDPMVARARAEERGETLSRLQQQTRRRELEKLVEEHPGFLMAVESLADWYRRHEGPARALRTVENWNHDDRERVPAWVRLAANLHDRVGQARRAGQLRRRAAEVHRLSGTFGLDLVREAMAGGDAESALETIRDYRRHAPWSQSWGMREASILRADDEIRDAISVVDALIDEAPGDAALRRRRAELLVVAGDRDRAMEAMKAAVVRRPQATRHQKFLEHLQPESSSFWEDWEITDLRELSEETDRGSQSWDRLVDQTIHQVASNGLSSKYTQRANRVLDDDGVGNARRTRISFTPGDERVEVLGVRVHKPDGSIAEDFDQWKNTDTRQGARQYNDRGYVNLQANNVDVGDVVEFRYVVHQVANENFRGDYFGDVSYVQSTKPIGKARYVVDYPEDWDLHFRAPELPHERIDDQLPGGESVDDRQITAFELTDVPRVRTESNQPGDTDVYDYVLVSNKETWGEVGTWWWELIEEQLVVDDAIRRTVREVTEGLKDDDAKLEAIHEYVVDNTRYLHVGLGIHGWKPYRTSTVFRNRYGDCKDKAALLKVMLEEAGIETHMVLVRTRSLGGVDDHPASMNIFNHAVAYIPSMDLFVDPTARYNGPRELTQMDQGAQALIVEDGGEARWVEMPVDDPEDNLVRQTLEVDYRDGPPVVSGEIESHGAEAVRHRRGLQDPERRDEDFEDRLRSTFSGLSLLEAEYRNLDALTRPTEITYTAEVPGAMSGGESSPSIYPFVESRELLDRYARSATRDQDLTFRVPFAREAEVRHRLPDDKVVQRVPESTEIDSPFGHLEMNYTYEEGELVVDIRYAITVQRVDVEDYPEFRRFVTRMDEALDQRIRLADRDDA